MYLSKQLNRIFAVGEFDYILDERKNGKKFIKVIMYFNDADGWIEVARINPTANKWSEDGYGDLVHLYDELRDIESIIHNIKDQIRKGSK